MLTDSQRLGLGFCILGLALGALGVVFLLDRALLTLGNLAFVAGIGLVLGLRRAVRFFVLKHKWKASLLYVLGALLIAGNHALLGLPLELYGVWLLFSAFLPQILSAARLSPVGNFILKLPGVKHCTRWLLDKDPQLPV